MLPANTKKTYKVAYQVGNVANGTVLDNEGIIAMACNDLNLGGCLTSALGIKHIVSSEEIP